MAKYLFNAIIVFIFIYFKATLGKEGESYAEDYNHRR